MYLAGIHPGGQRGLSHNWLVPFQEAPEVKHDTDDIYFYFTQTGNMFCL